jgi:hypothetical protein
MDVFPRTIKSFKFRLFIVAIRQKFCNTIDRMISDAVQNIFTLGIGSGHMQLESAFCGQNEENIQGDLYNFKQPSSSLNFHCFSQQPTLSVWDVDARAKLFRHRGLPVWV